MSISPQTFSHKDRKLTWFNRIFHMPIVVGTDYASQKWGIFSSFEAAAQKQEKLLQRSGDAMNELRFAFKLNLKSSKAEKFEVIFSACFLDVCWKFKCVNTILWCMCGCARTCWLFMWTLACVFIHIFRACSNEFGNTSKPIFQCLPKHSNNPVVLRALCSQDTWGTAEQQ